MSRLLNAIAAFAVPLSIIAVLSGWVKAYTHYNSQWYIGQLDFDYAVAGAAVIGGLLLWLIATKRMPGPTGPFGWILPSLFVFLGLWGFLNKINAGLFGPNEGGLMVVPDLTLYTIVILVGSLLIALDKGQVELPE